MTAPTLTEFLTARLDEDEEWARTHVTRHDPTRLLAEVAAKRQVVAALTHVASHERVQVRQGIYEYRPVRDTLMDFPEADEALQALASVYADHPDFREEWA